MKNRKAAPIGVIDSGVGGLTVVKEMLKLLPAEPIVYIGDDARCPYGPRSADEVREYTMEMASALSNMGIKMLVIACNTATAVALEELQACFSFPVLGVIAPGARAAVQNSSNGKIVVLGTEGTIKSGAYENAIAAISPEADIISLACPKFVPLVESGDYRRKDILPIVRETFKPLSEVDFDTAILGCTHYPLLHGPIQSILPHGTTIVSSANETVQDVKRVLNDRGIANESGQCEAPIFYTTGELDPFISIAKDWLGFDDPDVRFIEL
ncbi:MULTISPECIES: glutamate racemase [Sporosarcina]|uniref:Glutamate racemase n=1 Tax=Sporosarcina contaminans TaxID=633403 RepID=A0ABW3U1P0_9BACL